MSSHHPDFEATFIPGTNVLANKLGISNPDDLAQVEYQYTAERQREIENGTVHIARTYDQQHVLAIHRHLFQDLYDWAGTVRTYPLWRNPVVPFAEPGQISAYFEHAHQHVADTEWESLDHQSFSRHAATVYASVNFAHPSREGNGRTAKIFMTQLANDHGWDLDFDRVSPDEWNQAAALSAPDRGSFTPVPDELFPVFERLTVIKSPATENAPTSPGRDRAATAAERAARGPLSIQPGTTPTRRSDAALPRPRQHTTKPPRRDRNDDHKRGGPTR